MGRAKELRLLSQQVLVVGEDLRDYQVVELLDAEGRRTALYSRYLNAEGSKWLRHGVYQTFYQDGRLQSEGAYHHDVEHGHWRDLYDNGVVAAEGYYYKGEHVGTWQYWDPNGNPEEPDTYGPMPTTFEW